MGRIAYREKDLDLLGRLLRSEARGEGNYGMKLVGNVLVNRCKANCLTFKKIKTVYQAVYQKGQFEGVQTPSFQGRATSLEKRLAKDCLEYWRDYPAYRALFFQAPGKKKPCKKRFWGTFAGRYKNHCFYDADKPNSCNIG